MARGLRPLFVTVTWGAGGSTAGRSLELAEICQRQLGLTTCLHLTCTNMSKRIIEETLRTAKDMGIRNILALRGDPPRGDEYKIDAQDLEGSEEFVWATDLIRFIRKEYGDYFCIGVAGYPEGHSDESHPANKDPLHDMPYLLEKVREGADFITTQLFFDENAFLSYERLVRDYDGGAMKDIPIIPALMPIQSFSIFKRTTQLCHVKVPHYIIQSLEQVKADDEKVKEVGVEILSSIIDKIKSTPSPHRRGFHFFPLNLEKAVSLTLEKCKLLSSIEEDAEDSCAVAESEPNVSDGTSSFKASRKLSSRRQSSPHNHLTSDTRSTSSLEPPSRATTLAISHGIGSLGREATWDDYPNGRFGDARSPAFGEIDGYGPSLHLSPAAARIKWGSPTSLADISELFLRHLRGNLDQLPWSEGPLNAETRVIQSQLCALIEQKGWLSIASQPSADGIASSDPTFGWGPRGGFCFQKAFVEFWIPATDWHSKLKPRLQSPDIAPTVSWYASASPQAATGNSVAASTNGTLAGLTNGTADTNPTSTYNSTTHSASTAGSGAVFESSSPASAVDSVTWGVFPGKEIVTPTIIEEMSFRAWVDEAFGIWREWERCYPPHSPSRKVIRSCREDMWLVNVIGHVYQNAGGLWEILLGA